MNDGSEFSVVLVTAPDLETARVLARGALAARLVACANLIPQIESHYWWQGRLESGGEVLIVMKTAKTRLDALEAHVLDHHPYDTPEIVALSLAAGTARYLDWLRASGGPQ
ncbi:MAG: divalent-cation tolerance protein CutA [Verrucomicrobiales bacterium]|nr:divalent-cation tolerance protein CutA [Verrucomicrobiales bacterium]